jgi:predicted dehydrogenase
MMNDRIKVGLCSYGLSGQVFHAPFISKIADFELDYILERNKNLSKEKYHNSKIINSFDELISIKDLNLLVINTPTHLHFDMTKRALEAGKHIVLEKPMCAKFSEAQFLVKEAEKRNLILAVFHNRRFESGFKTLETLVKSQTLGDLTYFKAHFNRFKPDIGIKKWKEESVFEGSGIFYDLAPHLIDQCLQLFGEPQSIESKLEKQRKDTQVVDYFKLIFHYKNGFKAELEAGLSNQTNEPKFQLVGSKGKFIKQKEDHQEDSLRTDIFPPESDPDQGIIYWNNGEIETLENPNASYLEFYKNIANVLLGKEELLVTTEEALKVMEIISKING